MPSRRSIISCVLVLLLTAVVGAQQRDPKQYQQVLENPDRLAALQVPPIAKAVGDDGKVYAIDVDSGLLAIVDSKTKAEGVTNVATVVAGATDPRLPEPVDLIFLCDTLHHLPNQASYVRQFAKLLRPGGRVVVIEFAEGHWPAGHEEFTITPAQVDGWMQAAGFRRTARHTFLETNFFHVYEPATR
jgi:arsenite methyltransferase